MRLRVLRNLSWVAVFAGPLVAAGSPEYPKLVLFALVFATSAAITLAWLNGATTRRTIGEPISHVRPAPRLTTPVEDALHIASFNEYRRRLDANLDDIGRTLKVDVDIHRAACGEGGRFKCECPLGDTGGAA